MERPKRYIEPSEPTGDIKTCSNWDDLRHCFKVVVWNEECGCRTPKTK